jgi:hypothetical protein
VPLYEGRPLCRIQVSASGLATLLVKRGVDVQATFEDLSEDDREIVIHRP